MNFTSSVQFVFCMNLHQFVETIKSINSIKPNLLISVKKAEMEVFLLDVFYNVRFYITDSEGFLVKKELEKIFDGKIEDETISITSLINTFYDNHCINEKSFFRIDISDLSYSSLKTFLEEPNMIESFEILIFISRYNKEIEFNHLKLDSYKLIKHSNKKVYYIDPYLFKNFLTCVETYNEIKCCFEDNHKLTMCYNSKFDYENIKEDLKSKRDSAFKEFSKNHETIDKDNFHDRHIITNGFIIDFNSGSDIINTDEKIITDHGKLKKNNKATGIKLFIPYKKQQVNYYNRLLKYLNLKYQ